MTIGDRIRIWLGLEGIPRVGLFAASEKAQRDRHIEVMAALKGIEDHLVIIRDTIPKIEQMFHVEHINRRQFTPPVVDFESGQLQFLAEMLANPPKEDN
jgi:hypothetical protein